MAQDNAGALNVGKELSREDVDTMRDLCDLFNKEISDDLLHISELRRRYLCVPQPWNAAWRCPPSPSAPTLQKRLKMLPRRVISIASKPR